MRLATLLGAALLACSFTFGPLPAAAQDAAVDEARAAFEAGQIAYGAGRFAEALSYFERAYELTEEPDLLYNVATVHDRLRHDEEALAAYRAYLEARPDAPDRPNIEARIRVLEEAIAADEQAPPVEASAVEASAVEASAEAAEERPDAPTLETREEGGATAAAPDAGAPARSGGGPGAGPWVLLGAGAAVAGAGGVFLGLTLADIDRVEEAQGVPWADVRDAADRVPIFSSVGYAAAGLGLAMVIGGVVWAAVGEEGTTEVSLGPGGIVVRGQL
jgi:tetratricopeptide (TPR) repeat protein